MDEDKVLKDAQYRKGLSIAFFNATNNAVELVKMKFQGQDITQISMKSLMDAVTAGRDWLLDEHKKYYAEVIAKVGVNFDAAKTIDKLKATKNIEELATVWRSLSADERHDEAIIKCKDEMKKQHEVIH